MAQIGTGRIVNIASIQGNYGAERSSTYSASKHAVIGYTRSIAVEWAPHGITCNAICPGYIDTHQGARDDHSQNFLARVAARTPVGRTAGPDEVADLVAWMIGTPSKRPNSSYLNGSIITLDGGITAGLGL
jgi:3-oxoacyl-[acyl-carrier protein] reductase